MLAVSMLNFADTQNWCGQFGSALTALFGGLGLVFSSFFCSEGHK
jgi:hypothetical protein